MAQGVFAVGSNENTALAKQGGADPVAESLKQFGSGAVAPSQRIHDRDEHAVFLKAADCQGVQLRKPVFCREGQVVQITPHHIMELWLRPSCGADLNILTVSVDNIGNCVELSGSDHGADEEWRILKTDIQRMS